MTDKNPEQEATSGEDTDNSSTDNGKLSSDITADVGVMRLFSMAKQINDDYRIAEVNAEVKMLAWLRARMPVGLVINTKGTPNSQNPRPPYLLDVKTIHGNSRGSGLFRIEKVRCIELHPRHLHLSKWQCDATPISEKTGKDMSAAAGNSRSTNQFVVLQGSIARLD